MLVFLAAMSIFPKKFNRYLVPIFPAIDIIAAYGLMALGQALAGAQRVKEYNDDITNMFRRRFKT